ncbi:MAG: enoyl-CoA hydratase-related protein [Candidatus Nanopelagicales bacterium]
MQSSDPVLYSTAGGVATITLNKPDARNVLDAEVLPALQAALDTARDDDNARVVVLTGSGNSFCAGADLRGAAAEAEGSFAGSAPAALARALTTMLELPKPVIGRVQGHVAGGGNGLVAACDLAVAADSAMFAFSEVRVGVAPAVISVVCLRRMRAADASELMLTGERVTAERAQAAGLVHKVVPADALDGAVGDYVDRLLLGGPLALAATKELLRRVPPMSRDDAFEWTAQLSASLFASDEAREGMTAFVERRPPVWAPPPDGADLVSDDSRHL